MRRTSLFILFFSLAAVIFSASPAAAFTPVKVIINEETMQFRPSAGVVNGTTLVPLRQVFESLQATVHFEDATKTVIVSNQDVTMKLTINSLDAMINGQPVKLTQAPGINDGVTFVNLRFLAEGLGSKVQWDQNTLTVRIDA